MYQSFNAEINMPWCKEKDSTIFKNGLKTHSPKETSWHVSQHNVAI